MIRRPPRSPLFPCATLFGSDRGVGAVGADHVEALGVVLAVDELVVGGARGVGPGAVAADRERAVAAGGAGLRHEGRRAVGGADGWSAGGRKSRLPAGPCQVD